ncbi:hypothetical protein BMG03_17705 [Thioclava nitratireducens]|uniref:Aminotransferase class I/classII domain-containing protein n=1 Tax=Thioclava nitratireducens TaxID=1915078 RepID=A0ABN4XAI0_9RHOB|nr:hypothetical protein BMG03_17705 [Thioclava nitratireducens]
MVISRGAVLQELDARAVFVRMPFVAPQNRCIRVSVGPEAELDAFAAALPDALKAARAPLICAPSRTQIRLPIGKKAPASARLAAGELRRLEAGPMFCSTTGADT